MIVFKKRKQKQNAKKRKKKKKKIKMMITKNIKIMKQKLKRTLV